MSLFMNDVCFLYFNDLFAVWLSTTICPFMEIFLLAGLIVNIYIILCQIYYDLENEYYDNC